MLDYNPTTGIFLWRAHPRFPNLTGTRAGTINAWGYRIIAILNGRYRAGRIAWLYYYGYMPRTIIDHVDLDKENDRIKNLRMSTKSNNGANRVSQKNNTSGYKGVFWHRGSRKWMVQIKARGQLHYFGLHETKNKAAQIYKDAAIKLFGKHARIA